MKLMCQQANKKQTSLRRVLRPGTFRPLHVLALLLLIPSFALAQVTISNLSVAQRPGTKLVDITYDLSYPDTPTVNVTLEISNAEVQISAPSLTGAIGAGVQPGIGHNIVWNMAEDWNGSVADLRYTLSALAEMPTGGDSGASSWVLVNERWVKNYYANGHITMSDRVTLKMYLYDASMLGKAAHYSAISLCDKLNYANSSQWTQPTRDDLVFLSSQKNYFNNVKDEYWSSTYSGYSTAYVIQMLNGTYWADHFNNAHWIWPCRAQ